MTPAGGPPLVSVVTPFYNAERYLDEAVASVVGQSYDAWELLLVDDGSTDGSTAIAERLAARYPQRVRRIEHPGHARRGVSASRGLGVRAARGELLAFLDADDVWLPGKLGDQVPLLLAHPEAGMLYGNTRYWYSWAGVAGDARRDYLPRLGVPSGTLLRPPHLLTMYLRGAAAVPCTCSLLMRRDAVLRAGGPEDAFRDMYEDQAFYAKMILTAPVLVVDRCWDLYRQHADSTVALSRQRGEARAARLAYLEWLTGYVAGARVDDAALTRALARAMWRVRHPAVDEAITRTRRALHRVRGGVARRLPRRTPRPDAPDG